MSRGNWAWRARLLAACAVVVAVCVAAPALSAALEGEPPLDSPQAASEREQSEFAYADLTPAEEEDLLRQHFAPQLEAIEADPARALGEVSLQRIDSPTEALATVDGETVLLEAEVPLRVAEEDGDLHKVELALEQTPNGYEPANPLVDLDLPAAADEAIAIGDDGVAITPVGTSDEPASEFGDEDLFLPAAHEDTGFLLSPVAGGLELSALLSSRNSPQQLAFDVSLPPGAALRSDGAGGAQVVDADGTVTTRVTAPYAVDAQGSEVPTSLAVEGNSLVISVPHQDLDVAYPLFVDPEFIEENWSGFSDTSKLGYWKWAYGGVGAEDFIGRTSCIVTCWGNGLYLRARSSFTYPGGSWARWWFTPQGSTTFMRRVILGPINYDAHGCSANEPHPYVGVWNDSGSWKVLSNAYPSGWATSIDTGSQNLGAGTRTAFVGIQAGGTVNLACGRDYRLGGATLFLDDPENPSAGAPSGYPTGWIKSGQSFTINAPASDPGLGVYAATLSPGGSPPVEKKQGCNGHYSSACPGSYTFQFPIGAASFDEGEKPVRFSAKDALEKGSNTQEWNLKVDRTPPEIDLAGELATATDETEGDSKDDKDRALPLPVYNLTINTTDGRVGTVANPVQPAEKRSGVKKIQVFLDANTTPLKTWEEPSCGAGNCPLSKTFTLKLNELSADSEHYLRILATDFAGNAPRERKLEFEYIPATGMKDEYVMQYFPLPDGSGDEDEEEHPRRPELAVNLVNGNLVYRQKDVDVEGAATDLELELFYNSLLPDSQSSEFGEGWTLAQTPELEVENGEGTVVEESGGVESKVDLPASTGEESFDKYLQSTVAKEADGGYELSDESGETDTSVAFDSSGKVDELRTGSAATVDYDYEGGELAEISVEDPGTANVAPGSLEEDAVYPDLALSHSANFGSLGSADGQLKAPADTLLDPQGNIWVLDRGNGRIEKFGPDGQFISKFGTAGSAEGQLSNPNAFAMDAAGNFLVAENGRVQKFSPSGQFLSKFGSAGSGPGQFEFAAGIAVGSDGSIWVGDFNGVQRFTASGQFIERVGTVAPGVAIYPQSLDTAPNGDVFVALPELDKVKVYDKEGDFLRAFGSTGTGPGQFSSPTELDVDRDGNVWVGDAATDRVQLYNDAGEFVTQFGSVGSGAQQFQLTENSGIAADGMGRVWVADPGNNRLARWLAAPFTSFLHSANIGSLGSADGQLKTPADTLLDPQGNLWVLDRGNGRIEKFGPDGQFISKFGTAGSAEGQLNSPTAFAMDAAGNLLVLENSRVQKFSQSGQLLAKFGAAGSSPGQFEFPTAITVGIDGSIWIADTFYLQRFTAAGQLIERIGTPGGSVSFGQSLDTAPSGDVFAAFPETDKIKVFDKEGDFLRSFGSSGTGPGQFSDPTEVDVDADGNVWVGDAATDRVEVFDNSGDFIAQFGSAGSGAQQFQLSERSGVAADGMGRVWIADPGNSRMGEWLGGNDSPSSAPVLTEDDPQVEVNVSEGLVESIEGDEAGTVSYEHSGDLLTEVSGPESEADFSYDEAGRMTEVTLPNGTYAKIAYEGTYGRVKTVTVSAEGASPKTTSFTWSDEPHRTTVLPPDAPATTYDIAADGSIFKWWNAKQPPVFDDLAGTLYDPVNRETSAPIPTGVHNLVIQAHDDEGVASIQIVANNDQLVDEKTCPEISTEPSKCATLNDEWVTETASWSPGILYLEAIATDRLGESTSQRFWVNIPYTPPPEPEAEEPPRFNDILHFREEFGLDLDLKGDESAINDRIFELMGDWNNPATPAGEVARVTDARWGVPLRAIDAAELEYRQAYIEQAATAIPDWAKSNAATTYAGYYVDHRAGGLIRVGFTTSQAESLQALKQAGLLTASDRLALFPSAPQHSYDKLIDVQYEVAAHASSLPSYTRAYIDIKQNLVMVGTSGSASSMTSALATVLGPDSGAAQAFYDPSPPAGNASGRERVKGRVKAGDRIVGEHGECTAGFGTWLEAQDVRGAPIYKHFLTTAAHCGPLGELFIRFRDLGPDEWEEANLGRVRRTGIEEWGQVDGAAILLQGAADAWAPRQIYLDEHSSQPVTGVTVPVPGMIVKTSGATTDEVYSGYVEGPPVNVRYTTPPVPGNPQISSTWEVPINVYERKGDSGGPVWEAGTGNAVGLWNAGNNPSFVTPMLAMATDDWNEEIAPLAPGVLAVLGFSPGNLSTAP
jgi:tripartite motif-containing protein 71